MSDEINDYLDREEVLTKLWQLLFSSEKQEKREAYALAYCGTRHMGFITKHMLKKEYEGEGVK